MVSWRFFLSSIRNRFWKRYLKLCVQPTDALQRGSSIAASYINQTSGMELEVYVQSILQWWYLWLLILYGILKNFLWTIRVNHVNRRFYGDNCNFIFVACFGGMLWRTLDMTELYLFFLLLVFAAIDNSDLNTRVFISTVTSSLGKFLP